MASAIESSYQFFSEAGKVRSELLVQRQALLAKLEEIDAAIKRLPDSADEPRPVAPEEWQRRKRVLGTAVIGRPNLRLNSRDIIHVTAQFYGVTPAKLTGPDRFASISRARHVAMYLARKYTGESSPEMGRAFGDRDHTTILAGVTRIERQVLVDAELHAEVDHLKRAIEAACAQRPPEPVSLPPPEGQSD